MHLWSGRIELRLLVNFNWLNAREHTLNIDVILRIEHLRIPKSTLDFLQQFFICVVEVKSVAILFFFVNKVQWFL